MTLFDALQLGGAVAAIATACTLKFGTATRFDKAMRYRPTRIAWGIFMCLIASTWIAAVADRNGLPWLKARLLGAHVDWIVTGSTAVVMLLLVYGLLSSRVQTRQP